MHANKPRRSSLYIFLLLLSLVNNSHLLQAQSRENTLDSFFTAINKDGNINGSVLIAENGNIIYQRSFGYADEQKKIPNTANTLFQIASVSKLFTAIAVLQLYEQKKLSLSKHFSDYFPEFPYPNVTIQQMLFNTSGIANTGDFLRNYWRLNRDTIFTLQDIIPALKASNTALEFEPGEGWDYSNTNFNLLALLVEKVSGEKFEDYLQQHIFKPAGMKNSFQALQGVAMNARENIAYNYATPFYFSMPVRVDSFAIPYYKIEYRTVPGKGAANIYSSVTDLLHLHDALSKGRLLKSSGINLLFSPSTKNNGRKIILEGVGTETDVIGDFYWGPGNRISLDSSMGKIIWESGGMPGCAANIINNLTKNQIIIWLDNKESAATMNNIFEALNILNNKPFTIKKAKQHVANVYGKMLVQKGEDIAFAQLTAMIFDTAHNILNEDELNQLAYDFSGNGFTNLALSTFRTAILLFPNSDNLFNSYGEVLAKYGKKEEAILMYQRSLSLNPGNEDSQKALQDLQQQ